ncbi:helix-turn-helix domain-containing protein [Actinosynnema sp. CS-041913]|uniref:helix-turn-helix domain-containing protein n=1 Tax=Actinosynnema sp. CS-041913 TaxID=3239917 RepID=UPI003D92E969
MVRTTPKAVALGAELRAARERAGFGLREFAKRLGIDHSKLSRTESGERPPEPELTAEILTNLGVVGSEFERIVDMARITDDSVWVAVSLPDQQSQLSALLSFEQMATRLTSVSPLLVPGLLQTGGYARAIMRGGRVPQQEIEIRVATRLGRRDVLMRDDPVRFTAFIGVAAMRGGIGGPSAMVEQLNHLLKMAEWPNITLHAIPEAAGWHPGLEGEFLVIDTPAMSVVHVENRLSGLFYQETTDVTAYQEAVDQVLSVALGPSETVELIAGEVDRIKESE